MESTSVYGFMIRSGVVRYRCGNESGSIDVSVGRPPRGPHAALAVWCDLSAERGGLRCTLRVRNGMGLPVEILSASLDTNLVLPSTARVFANGWQSGTASDLVRIADGLRRPLVLPEGARARGDYDFVRYGRGRVHSWTFSWFGAGDAFSWVGSLDESTSFTRFEYAAGRHGSAGLSIHADCDGLVLSPYAKAAAASLEVHRLLDVFLVRGSEAACVDAYFDLFRRTRAESAGRRALPREPGPPAVAWDGRDEARPLLRDSAVEPAVEPFRLHDGPPDYLFVGSADPCAGASPSVPRSPAAAQAADLRTLLAAVHRAGTTPGVSLSPCACGEDCDLSRERKDYLARDAKGKPMRIGAAQGGGRPMFVLDTRQSAYRRHLEALVRPLVAEPGAGLLRFAHLDAAARLGGTGTGRTRAQSVQDALRLLQDLCRGKPFLVQDVPLGAAFGAVEYAAVAPEPRAAARTPLLRRLLGERGIREDADRFAAVRTLFGRRHLDGRAFRSDPGSFTLRRSRDPDEESSRVAHAKACTLFGGLLATADAVPAYTSVERDRFREAVARRGSARAGQRLLSAEIVPDGSIRVLLDVDGETREETVRTAAPDRGWR